MKPAILNHIGIAAPNIPQLQRLFAILGLKVGHVETVADQGVKAHFLTLPKAETHLELLEPVDPEGTVSKFVEKRGPGIHHLSFEVERGQLDLLCATLVKEGYRLIYDVPKRGAGGMRINFIHPATAGGILVEVMEPLGASTQ